MKFPKAKKYPESFGFKEIKAELMLYDSAFRKLVKKLKEEKK